MSSNTTRIHQAAKAVIKWFIKYNTDSTFIRDNDLVPTPVSDINDIPVLDKFIDINVEPNKDIEIPILGGDTIWNTINNNPQLESIKLPLYERYKPIESNVSNTILKDMFNITLKNVRLRKYILHSSVVYGAVGILFDEDFNLLMYCTKEFSPSLGFKRNLLNISPEVFRGSNIVSKAILNNVIIGILDKNKRETKDNIIHLNLTDLSNVVQTVSPPTSIANLDKDLMDVVKRNYM